MAWNPANAITDEKEAAAKEVRKIVRVLKPMYESGGLLTRDDILGYLSNPEYVGKSENSEAIKSLVEKARTYQETLATDNEMGPSVTEYIEYRIDTKEHSAKIAKQLFKFIPDAGKSNTEDPVLRSILKRLDQEVIHITRGRAPTKPTTDIDKEIDKIVGKLTLDNLGLVKEELMKMVTNKSSAAAAGGKRKTRKSKKTRKLRKTKKN